MPVLEHDHGEENTDHHDEGTGEGTVKIAPEGNAGQGDEEEEHQCEVYPVRILGKDVLGFDDVQREQQIGGHGYSLICCFLYFWVSPRAVEARMVDCFE